jgi:predicted RNase H-like HicB family nuclease
VTGDTAIRREDYLHIPYMLMVWSTPGPDGDWVRHAEYPELPGCVVESPDALEALGRLDEMKETIILDRLARGQAVPVPRPPLRA